jgi:hypothetical protein
MKTTPGTPAVTARVDAGGTVTAITDSGREDRTCRAIAADMRGIKAIGSCERDSAYRVNRSTAS